jgi:uncharacterized membrane protein
MNIPVSINFNLNLEYVIYSLVFGYVMSLTYYAYRKYQKDFDKKEEEPWFSIISFWIISIPILIQGSFLFILTILADLVKLQYLIYAPVDFCFFVYQLATNFKDTFSKIKEKSSSLIEKIKEIKIIRFLLLSKKNKQIRKAAMEAMKNKKEEIPVFNNQDI